MKRVWISRPGPPKVLEVREEPTPDPGPGELRVRVRAAGVNFADLMARMGTYQDGPPPPCVVGYEVSGVVDAVGEGVSPAREGERVLAATRFGGYASHVVVPAETCVALPAQLGLSEAAALPVTGLTSWMILEEMHRVRAGDRILVHSAGGALGLVTCDLAKRRGATVVGTASARKHAFLQEWGFDRLVDYRSQDYEEVLASGPKFDLVMDPLGGHHWGKGLRLLKPGGKLACYGMSVNAEGHTARRLAMVRNLLRIPFV
ncbi:MAG: zinc-binding dehydrogenase, partial [Myxococcota bacterium]